MNRTLPFSAGISICFVCVSFLSLLTNPAFAQLSINEVFYDPSGSDTGLEFIEIVNTSLSPIDITGYELKLADSNYFTFPAFTFPADSRILVHNNLDGLQTPTEFFTGTMTNMGNTSGSVALFSGPHATTNIIDFVQYGASGQQWESAAVSASIWIVGDLVADAPEGLSLNLNPDGIDTNSSANWSQCSSSPLSLNCAPSTATATVTDTPTMSPTSSPTNSPPPTFTPPHTSTPTITPSGFPTYSPTPIPTMTIPPTLTPTRTSTPSATPSGSPTPTFAPTGTASPSPTLPPPSATPTTPPIDFPVVINELLYDPTGTDTGLEWIELLNTGSAAFDLTGYELKPDGAAYYVFPPFVLASGARVVIHINLVGSDSDTELFTGPSSNMGNTAGSIVLFTGSVHSDDTIRDFMQYGAAGQSWESAAVDAGIWSSGEFTQDPDEGFSLNLDPDGIDTNSSLNWNSCLPTFLTVNCESSPPTFTPTTGPGSPTATPPPSPTSTPVAQSGVVINEIFADPTGSDSGFEFVELYNNSTQPIDLTGYDIKPDDAAYYTIPEFILEPDAYVTIHINTSGTNTDIDLFTGPSSNMGNTAGFIALFNSTTHGSSSIVDYVEYGQGGQTWESSAVSAGIWTADDFAPAAIEGESMNMCPNGQDHNIGSNWLTDLPSAGSANTCTAPPPSPTATSTIGPTSTPTITPTPHPTVEPVIRMAGLGSTSYRISSGGTIQFIAWITDPDNNIDSVEVLYAGLPIFELYDDGQHSDFAPGDGFFGYELNVAPAPYASSGSPLRLLFKIIASDTNSYDSTYWPLLTVSGGMNGGSSYQASHWWLESASNDEPAPANAPFIYMAGFLDTRLSSSTSGTLKICAVTQGEHLVESVELYFNGIGTGVFLKDDGLNDDFGASDGVFGLRVPIAPGSLPAGDYLLQLKASDNAGLSSDLWPYLTAGE